MLWHQLTDSRQLQDITHNSLQQPGTHRAVVIFKHSTRCSISSMALNRFESKWTDDPEVPVFFLDLLKYRDISNEIASLFGIEHASPQVLVIKNGVCVYHASHNGIIVSEVKEAIAKQTQ
jgi:bacillithiol system protein YtxJ